MTFNPDKQAQFGMSPNDIQKLKDLQNKLKTKYGNNEHQATVKICEEIGLSPTAVETVNNLEWSYIPRLISENEIESLIPIYCDMRIGPKGILTLGERLLELKQRVDAKDYEDNVKNGNSIEQIIKRNVNIEVNSIQNEQINRKLDDLLQTDI